MVSMTRFDGGVAFLWAASAILIAALLRTPTRYWREQLWVCAVCSALVTGLLGLGSAAAIPFAVVNMAEAALAAFLFRRVADGRQPLQSLGWIVRFVLVLGIIAPFAAAVLATVAMLALAELPAPPCCTSSPAMRWVTSPSPPWR